MHHCPLCGFWLDILPQIRHIGAGAKMYARAARARRARARMARVPAPSDVGVSTASVASTNLGQDAGDPWVAPTMSIPQTGAHARRTAGMHAPRPKGGGQDDPREISGLGPAMSATTSCPVDPSTETARLPDRASPLDVRGLCLPRDPSPRHKRAPRIRSSTKNSLIQQRP